MTLAHLFKRIILPALAAVAAAAVLTGCRGIELENKVEQVEGFSEAEAMIVAANERNRYQNAYTAAVWDIKPDGEETFDRLMIENVKTFMQELRTLTILAAEKGIDISSVERDELRRLSEEYYRGLSDADREYTGCTEDDVAALYNDYHLAVKTVKFLTANANSELSDSETKVIRIQQVMTGDIKKAKAILKKVKLDGSDFGSMAGRYSEAEEIELTLRRGDSSGLIARTAFSMDEGQISNILAVEDRYYIIKCINDYDEEATLERKNMLQKAIENRMFREVYEPYRKEHKVVFDESYWDRLDLRGGQGSTADNFFELYDKYFG